MDTRNPWDPLVRVGVFVLASSSSFAAIMFIGMFLWAAFDGRSPSGLLTGILVVVAGIAGVAIGVVLAFRSSVLSIAAVSPRRRPLWGTELEVRPLSGPIERGPAGTVYEVNGPEIVVTAANRGWHSYVKLTFVVCVCAFVVFCIWNDSDPLQHLTFDLAGSMCICLIGVVWAISLLRGATTIHLDAESIVILEGFPGHRSRAVVKQSEATRITVRRIDYAKGSSTAAFIETSDGFSIATFGRCLPWIRLCYLKQVVDEVVIKK